MKKFILAITLIFIPILTLANGYGNTKWGMSPEQVILAEKGKAIAIDDKNYTYGKAKAKSENIEIGLSSHTIYYIFDNVNKLIGVEIKPDSNDNPYAVDSNFANLNSLLTQKYGKPKFSDEKKSTWRTQDTTIELIKIKAMTFSAVYLSYKPNSLADKATASL